MFSHLLFWWYWWWWWWRALSNILVYNLIVIFAKELSDSLILPHHPNQPTNQHAHIALATTGITKSPHC